MSGASRRPVPVEFDSSEERIRATVYGGSARDRVCQPDPGGADLGGQQELAPHLVDGLAGKDIRQAVQEDQRDHAPAGRCRR